MMIDGWFTWLTGSCVWNCNSTKTMNFWYIIIIIIMQHLFSIMTKQIVAEFVS